MSAPLNVGVLTFHRCINYGSYWQARCLVEGLQRRGHRAVLLDHHARRVNRAEWRCALSPHLPFRTRPDDRRAYARKTRRFFAAFDQLPLSTRFDLDRPEEAEPHDLVLVGSDEVWNLWHPWYGRHPLFYGSGAPAPRLAAYAASFGNQPAAERLDPEFAALLSRFEAISVRDDNSREMIRDALGQEPELVLDPCLQFPSVVRQPATGGDYVLIYGHSFPAWFQAGVRNRARAAGQRLVSFGYRNDWADEQWLESGPEEFPRHVAGAAAVATTFFHGCVFALLHGKPLACAASDYRANKVRSLMGLLGEDGRLMEQGSTDEAYHAALAVPPGATVEQRLAEMRARSDAFLDHVLG
jgi:hypothetical protein